jgi:hypothetical protein
MFFDRARDHRPDEQQVDQCHANSEIHRDGIGPGIAPGRERIEFL